MLKAIIFDVDGVLVDSSESRYVFLQSVLKEAGYKPVSREAIFACSHLPLWQSLEKLTGTTDQTEIKRIWELGHDPKHRDSSLFRFPNNLEYVLKELHKNYKLAIVTSRIKVGLDSIFSVKEIKHLFDVVVSFEDYTKPKPDPEPLQVALEKLGIEAHEAIYIGDSDTDIEAATAAGMPSIHLAVKHHKDATHGIARFEELLDVIKLLATAT